jgi:hypothetical protein
MTNTVQIANVGPYPVVITRRYRAPDGTFVHTVEHERVEPGHFVPVLQWHGNTIVIEEVLPVAKTEEDGA